MATATTTPATAAGLLAALRPFGPAVEGDALVFTSDPLAGLDAALEVLHTGVRAALTSQTWFGCGSTSKTAAARPLDPTAPVPAWVTLLCVAGDARWDRIHPSAQSDLPHLFASASPAPRPVSRCG